MFTLQFSCRVRQLARTISCHEAGNRSTMFWTDCRYSSVLTRLWGDLIIPTQETMEWELCGWQLPRAASLKRNSISKSSFNQESNQHLLPAEIDYTDEMVLDNFIRGLSDEEIKSKVFAMQEENCTPEKVLRFVEAEELGRSSVRGQQVTCSRSQATWELRCLDSTHQYQLQSNGEAALK